MCTPTLRDEDFTKIDTIVCLGGAAAIFSVHAVSLRSVSADTPDETAAPPPDQNLSRVVVLRLAATSPTFKVLSPGGPHDFVSGAS